MTAVNNSTSAWIRKAEQDLKLANNTLKDPEDLGDLISFHAQQCVEKFLKSALVFLQVDFPKTHDLKKICQLLRPYWLDMPFTCDEVATLTLYAISTRYPHLWEEVPVSEAIQAVEMAQRIKDAVLAFLKEKGYEG